MFNEEDIDLSEVSSQISDGFLYDNKNNDRRQYNKVSDNVKTCTVYQTKRNKNNDAVKRSRLKSKVTTDKLTLKKECCNTLTSMYDKEKERLTSVIHTMRGFIRGHASATREEALGARQLLQSEAQKQHSLDRTAEQLKKNCAERIRYLDDQLNDP